MLFLMSGSSAAGKSTVGPAIAERLSRLAYHDSDERHTNLERCEVLETWISTALEYQERQVDLLLACQAPLGELLACPSTPKVDGIAGCVLDCNDVSRIERIRARGPQHAHYAGMDILCWGVFHRMHASDPQWEQRVIRTPDRAHLAWSRWTHWKHTDSRWMVPVFDTTNVPKQTTVEQIANWVEQSRAHPPLSAAKPWWTDPA